MNSTLLVMAGGALGAGLRYHLGRLLTHGLGTGFPYGTLAANLAGGLAMGLLVGWLARSGVGGEQSRLFLGVGVLGGFTTFSAFSLDVVNMIEREQWMMAAGYSAASVLGAVLALFAGLMMMRQVA